MDILNFPIFAAAVIALHATPGPDTAYVVGRTIAQGRAAGVMSAVGIGCGCLVHTLLSTFGFTAIIAAIPSAFDIIRYVGAAYLFYQGLKLILSKSSNREIDHAAVSRTNKNVFYQAFLTNVLNPKVILFFLAFFPQFVSTTSNHKSESYLLLGLYFSITACLWAIGVAYFSGAINNKFLGRSHKNSYLNKIVGTLFVGMSARILILSK